MNRTSVVSLCLAGFWLLFAAQLPARAAESRSPQGEGDGPPIGITCIGLMAPAAVHVQALVPAKDPVSPLDCRYEWNFGDAGSAYDALPGWNAAHVYERPGEYRITLTVRQAGGHELHRQISVRIAPDTRQKFYVSADGSDQFDGQSPARPVRSAGRAFQLARNDAWILFRRGDIFPIVNSAKLSGSGLRLGNYEQPGGGGDPFAKGVPLHPTTQSLQPMAAQPLPVLKKVKEVPGQDSFFVAGRDCQDLLVQGIEFDSVWTLQSQFGAKKVPARAFTLGGTNLAFRWCSFKNLTDAINTELKPTGILVEGCTFSTEIRGYCIYANGTDHVYLGNVMRHSRQEHLIRATEPGVERVLVAYNDLRRKGSGKGSIEFRNANWFYVACNYFNEGTLRVGPQDTAQARGWQDVTCDWGVVQDNRLDNLYFHVRLGSHHVTFRNNVIRANDLDWAIIVACEKKGFDEVRKVEDVRIEHNTVINEGTKGIFCFVQGNPIGLRIRQNVFIAPHLKPGGSNAGIYASKSLAGIDEISGNLFPKQGAGGDHRIGGQKTERSVWLQQPQVKNEQYGPATLDERDNVPLDTEAGAWLGDDKRPREERDRLHPPERP